jgi:hypothetical protein
LSFSVVYESTITPEKTTSSSTPAYLLTSAIFEDVSKKLGWQMAVHPWYRISKTSLAIPRRISSEPLQTRLISRFSTLTRAI